MTTTLTKHKVTGEASNRKLIMEPCPKCQVNTAFQFTADTNYYIYCLNCGYIKNIHNRPVIPTGDGNK